MATRRAPNQFNPDYVIHPGEILEETLKSRSISHIELAKRTGLSMKTVSLITNGKAPLTAETAIHLEKALGVSAQLWSNLDAKYRLFQAKETHRERMKGLVGWLDTFPPETLRSAKVISKPADPVENLERLLAFFGVSSPEAWESRYSKLAVNFRKTSAFSSSWQSVTCWLRLSELEAEEIQTKPFSMERFKAALSEIRQFTEIAMEEFQTRMKDECADSGVAVAFIPELPKTRVCGATLWLTAQKALLSLSLRYKSDDQFWFSFFHEAGHIVLHGKKELFVEEHGSEGNAQENEADRFATTLLFPTGTYEEFVARGQFYESDIVDYARSINLAPGIVVGRLQHDKLVKYEWHNRLKKHFQFA
jgi:HTH-type transcriptional regulator/antitoxin HigA